MENISEKRQIEKLKEFSEFNKKLSDCVRYLGWNLEVWTYLWKFKEEAKTENQKGEIAKNGTIFFVIEDATYNHIIVTFYNLLDSDQKSRSILKYLEKTEQEMKLLVSDESERKVFSKKINSQKDSIKSHSAINHLRKRRVKKVAHFDKEYFFHNEKVDKDMPLSNEEITSLFKLFQEILDWHRENILNNSFPFSWGKGVAENSIKFMLSNLLIVEDLKEKYPEIYLEMKNFAVTTNQ